MNRLKVFGLVFTIFATLAMAGDGVDTPIGYVVENPSADIPEGEDIRETSMKVVRGSEEVLLYSGDEVYPGDRISTDATSSMSIAFLDHSAIKIFPSTEIL